MRRNAAATLRARAATPDADAAFWQRFDDPLLDELVDAALRREPRPAHRAGPLRPGERAAARGRVRPLADRDRSGRRERLRARAPTSCRALARDDRDTDSYAARVVAGWELDLFGRVRRNVESQRADAAASAADLAAAQVAIVGEVARSYLELRGLQERLRVARSNADNQRETLRIVAGAPRRRARHGVRYVACARAARDDVVAHPGARGRGRRHDASARGADRPGARGA